MEISEKAFSRLRRTRACISIKPGSFFVCVATGDLEEIIGHLYRHCICGNPHEPGERCPVAASEPVEMTGN